MVHISSDQLWKCWLKNKAPPSVLKDRAQGSLWEKIEHRAVFGNFHRTRRKEMALALQTIRNARKELKDLQQITDASILSKARIIGCTTTKAAMCKTLLNEVGAGILLVEEAAEIREADVLTR